MDRKIDGKMKSVSLVLIFLLFFPSHLLAQKKEGGRK